MNYWHCNTGNENNKDHMIRRNLCYIGLGNNRTDYEDRMKKKGNSTPKQFTKFERLAKSGDLIYLYENKVGYIAYGEYTGEIIEPQKGCELAPYWSKEEIQKHIRVKNWIQMKNPIKPRSPLRPTLGLLEGERRLSLQ